MRHCGNRTAEGCDRPQTPKGLLPRPCKCLPNESGTSRGQLVSPSIRYRLPYHGCGARARGKTHTLNRLSVDPFLFSYLVVRPSSAINSPKMVHNAMQWG